MKKFILFVCISFLPIFILKLFSQDTTIYNTETIEVEALKGIDKLTPITFENIKRETIENKYWMQDLPMFLNGNTSINAYSESGGSVGYSYFSIRGFDQRRISILINGTPQNDAEDHQVYWVDLSDITSSVENIQIQRGIGTALYGTSSIGGVVNIQTINYFKRKYFNFNSGFGSYNSQRFSLEYSSGLAGNDMGFYGKFTKISTDGYRDGSWSKHWSYFLSAGKIFGSSAVLKFNFYGSPIQNHLAYIGVTKDYLDGKVTGDIRKDRKYNFLTFPNETDNYSQPHYELIFNFQPSENIYISNTLNYMRGEGYFITNFPYYYGLDFSYFRLKPFYVQDTTTYSINYYRRNPDGTIYYDPGKGYVIERSNLVTNLYVNNNDWGWYPKVQINHNGNKGRLVIGGELRLHKSEHYGEVTFGDVLPPGTPANYRYYFYNGKKRSIAAYINEIFSLNEKFSFMAGAQFVNHRYSIGNDQFRPIAFDVDYNFLTPRAGINFNFDKSFRAFGNVSMSKREPRLKDIYDAENQTSRPNFRLIDTVNNIYSDPLVTPEQMMNYELGLGYTSDILNANLNFYLMNFTNEIVSNGQLDNVGQPINGNAGKSIHRGIELEAEYKPFIKGILQGFSVSGNLNISKNYFVEYREILGSDSLGRIMYGNDYSGNRILLNPDIIGNLSLNYFNPNYGLSLYFGVQYIGRQYLDNSENELKNPSARNVPGYVNKDIAPYAVFNAGLSVNLIPLFKINTFNKYLNKIELNLKVNNIFDRLYETTGSVDSYGIPYWIPAAERNMFFDLKIGF
jgi:iron complex outermembrane receptor protein